MTGTQMRRLQIHLGLLQEQIDNIRADLAATSHPVCQQQAKRLHNQSLYLSQIARWLWKVRP